MIDQKNINIHVYITIKNSSYAFSWTTCKRTHNSRTKSESGKKCFSLIDTKEEKKYSSLLWRCIVSSQSHNHSIMISPAIAFWPDSLNIFLDELLADYDRYDLGTNDWSVYNFLCRPIYVT